MALTSAQYADLEYVLAMRYGLITFSTNVCKGRVLLYLLTLRELPLRLYWRENTSLDSLATLLSEFPTPYKDRSNLLRVPADLLQRTLGPDFDGVEAMSQGRAPFAWIPTTTLSDQCENVRCWSAHPRREKYQHVHPWLRCEFLNTGVVVKLEEEFGIYLTCRRVINSREDLFIIYDAKHRRYGYVHYVEDHNKLGVKARVRFCDGAIVLVDPFESVETFMDCVHWTTIRNLETRLRCTNADEDEWPYGYGPRGDGYRADHLLPYLGADA